MITLKDLKSNPEIRAYIEQGDKVLSSLGFTEHSFAHATKVAVGVGKILKDLSYSDDQVRLGEIAGYIHDIGNSLNRIDHAQSGAILAFTILRDLNMPPAEVAQIVSAIGNHDETTSSVPDAVSAALVLADKSDIRKTRVRSPNATQFDVHDRVNFAANNADLILDVENKTVTLKIEIDTTISSVLEYFEIFLARMLLCKKAATVLMLKFQLIINNNFMV